MNNLIQWLICLIRRDMAEYEEDVGSKRHIYRIVRNKIPDGTDEEDKDRGK